MRLTASSKTRKEVCTSEKMWAYRKGVLSSQSLRHILPCIWTLIWFLFRPLRIAYGFITSRKVIASVCSVWTWRVIIWQSYADIIKYYSAKASACCKVRTLEVATRWYAVMKSESSLALFPGYSAGVTTRMCTVCMRLHTRGTAFAGWTKPCAHVMIDESAKEAIEPRTQDSQRKLL